MEHAHRARGWIGAHRLAHQRRRTLSPLAEVHRPRRDHHPDRAGRPDHVSQKSKLAEAIRYALSRWAALCRFLDDGRIEIDTNVVERSIRPIALNCKNALFAGSDGGAEQWAVIASLVETAKLNAVEPQSYLVDVIARIVQGDPQSQVDDLLQWAYAPAPLKAEA